MDRTEGVLYLRGIIILTVTAVTKDWKPIIFAFKYIASYTSFPLPFLSFLLLILLLLKGNFSIKIIYIYPERAETPFEQGGRIMYCKFLFPPHFHSFVVTL